MPVVELIILIMASWRLSHFLVEEEGPWQIMLKIRTLMGVTYDQYSQKQGTNAISDMLSCVWCTSYWVSWMWFLVYWSVRPVGLFIAVPFALSAGAILVEEVVNGSR